MIGISSPNSILGMVRPMQRIGGGSNTLDLFAITLAIVSLICLFFIIDREFTNVSPTLRLYFSLKVLGSGYLLARRRVRRIRELCHVIN